MYNIVAQPRDTPRAIDLTLSPDEIAALERRARGVPGGRRIEGPRDAQTLSQSVTLYAKAFAHGRDTSPKR